MDSAMECQHTSTCRTGKEPSQPPGGRWVGQAIITACAKTLGQGETGAGRDQVREARVQVGVEARVCRTCSRGAWQP